MGEQEVGIDSIIKKLILPVFAMVILVSLVSFEAIASDFSEQALVERTANSDHYYLGDGKYSAEIYGFDVNMKDSEGAYRPYTEVTSFKSNDDGLVLEWNNKTVKLRFYTKNWIGMKSMLSGMNPADKADLDFKTAIEKNRGSYYYNHLLNKTYQPSKIGYQVEATNVKCTPEGYSLVCGEQKIDFSQAAEEQGLGVSIKSSYVEFQGDNLSYIDPVVYLNTSHYGYTRKLYNGALTYDAQPSAMKVGSWSAGSSYATMRSYIEFNLSSIEPRSTINDVDLKFYVETVDVADCNDGNVDVNAYDVPDGTYTIPPVTGPQITSLHNGMNSGTDLGDVSSGGFILADMATWKTVDLGASADNLVQADINDSKHFIAGLVATDEYWEPNRADCEAFLPVTQYSNPPLLILNYTDNVPPRYQGISVTPSSPQIYDPAKAYQFNITFTDSHMASAKLFINDGYHNFTSATSGQVLSFNVTGLLAGTYSYHWCGLDDYANTNCTPTYTYTINHSGKPEIETGIKNAIYTATIHTDKQAYIRYMNGTQMLGRFDKIASYGQQRWLFNYITAEDIYTNIQSITPTIYVWENTSLAQSEIEYQVEAFINATRT